MKEFRTEFKRGGKWQAMIAASGHTVRTVFRNAGDARKAIELNKGWWAERQSGKFASGNPPTEWRIVHREVTEWVDTMTKEEAIEIAKEHGNEAAYNLLLLGGPDFFDGDYNEYNELLEQLESK